MRVFLTGATGFVGTAIVQELLGAGHQVTGLARSASSAAKLVAAGATVHQGDLEDIESLRTGAAGADGIIHAGFIHDFSRFKEVCEIDRIAIEAMSDVLAGSDRPFIITSGTALVSPGKLATEDNHTSVSPYSPRVSERAMEIAVDNGVRAAAIRLSPSVHGVGDLHGFIPMLINIAREKGFSAYAGQGMNCWSGVHRLDAARLYRLALENAVHGQRYHGVGQNEEAIVFKTIAEAIGRMLNIPVRSILPENATEHFGMMAGFMTIDCPASSSLTRQWLNWEAKHPTLLDDLETGVYRLI